MISISVKRIDGTIAEIGMDKFRPVAEGTSALHPGWQSTLVYSGEHSMFVELSESPQDIRGNNEGAAIEVSRDYAERIYGSVNYI